MEFRRRSLVAFAIAAALLAFVNPLARAEQANHVVAIPDLQWEPRSDWINVKTAPPGGGAAAKGDGVQDDTAAIQAAINRIQDGSTVYFPSGTYRITKTLVLPEGRFLGVSLLGHGRSTTLAWDGEPNGRMYWNHNGMTTMRYVGLTWDGRNKAAVGFDHSCLKVFETEIRHQHEAYRNFTEAGSRVGYELKVATAETLYDNCLFEHCHRGVALHNFNTLDHTFDGCEFRDCGVGVYGGKGTNCYVRNCHFERSGEVDIVCSGEQGSSARKCTSQGSKQFLEYGSSVGPFIMQDCHVDGWSNPSGAVAIHGAPVLLFDSEFTHAPNKEPPVTIGSSDQRLLLSNNKSTDSAKIAKPSGQSVVIEIPPGEMGSTVRSAEHSFLKSQVTIPGKVFDAKRDFGAKGDGTTDDTAAINRLVEAVRVHGQDAIAYLPPGQYAVSSTIKLTGSNYFFGGSGIRSALIWHGPTGGSTVEVHDPDHITLENISIGHHDNAVGLNAADVLQTSSGKTSLMTYDRVSVFGMYENKPLEHGIRFVGLGHGDRVQIREVNGNLRFVDSAAATILLRLSYEGTILVEGKSTARDGFLGGAVHLGTVTDPAIWLKDNQSLVMSDLYVESSAHHTRLEGDAALPAGRLVLQGAKFELDKPANNGLDVNNYRGEVLLGPYQFYVGNPIHHFVQHGNAPFALTMLGTLFYNSQPDFKLAPRRSSASSGASTVGLTGGDKVSAAKGISDMNVEQSMPRIVRALDDLRRLGTVDTWFNDNGAGE